MTIREAIHEADRRCGYSHLSIDADRFATVMLAVREGQCAANKVEELLNTEIPPGKEEAFIAAILKKR